MTVKWKWADDGSSVDVDGVAYTVSRAKFGEIAEYGERWDEGNWVFSRLHAADGAFQTGMADYRNAVENLVCLRRELAVCRSLLRERSGEVGAFFDPTGVAEKFASDPEALSRFIREVIERFAKMTVAVG